MRRHALLITMLLAQLPCASLLLPAQETPASVATVHQDADENYKALTARLEDLAAANETLTKNLTKLRDEVQKLADDLARASDRSKDSATSESIKHLKTAIEEVDKKRIEDQKLVLAQLDTLRKILEKPIVSRPPQSTSGNGNTSLPPKKPALTGATDNPRAAQPENGYNYSIQDGDVLSTIVAKLKKQGLNITIKQVMDANPGVNWNRLKINQTIFIPAPKQP